MQDLFIFTLSDFIGLSLSFACIVLIAGAAMPLRPDLRKAMISLILGLFFIAFSFIWSLVFERFAVANLPNLQPIFFALGMIWILFFAHRLFNTYKK